MSSRTLLCPKCDHVHDVPEHHLSEQESILLKCAACHHVWRYYTREMPEYERRLRDLLPLQETLPDDTPSTPRLSAHKHIYKKAVHHYHMDWWILVIASVMALLVLLSEVGGIPNFSWFYTQGSIFFRSVFSKVSPTDTAMSDAIQLNVLTSTLEGTKEDPLLLVKGEIANTSNQSHHLPVVQVHLMDKRDDGHLETRCTWDCVLENTNINPGEKRIFETKGHAKQHLLPSSVILHFKE